MIGLAPRRLRDLEDGIEDHDGVGDFQQRHRATLRGLRDLEDGIEGVRAGGTCGCKVRVEESLDCKRYLSLILQCTSLISLIH